MARKKGGPKAALSRATGLSPAAPGASPPPAAIAALAARTLLRRGTRRCILRPLDELLRLDEVAVLVLRDKLEADTAPRLVDFLHDHVDDVAAGHDVLDVGD